MMSEEWPGKMRAVGVANHDFGAFHAAAEYDWVDVVLARINYAGHAISNTPDKVAPVIEKIAQVGRKSVYGMRRGGCGSGFNRLNPGRAIRYGMEGLPGPMPL